MNPFYLFAAAWAIVLFLYELSWSDIIQPLCAELTLFVVVAVIASIIIGKLLWKPPRLIDIPRRGGRSSVVTIVLCAGFCVDYWVGGQVPLISILTGFAGYATFSGIPTFHPAIVTFTGFYSLYLFFLARCPSNSSIRNKLLIEYATLVIVCYVLAFNRGGLFINLFCAFLIVLVTNKIKLRPMHITVVATAIIVALFLFGCLGNIRHGGSPFDTSYLTSLFKKSANYPTWLPDEFYWAYIYIVTPLANLNLNVIQGNAAPDIVDFFCSFLPDAVNKRMRPDLIQTDMMLINPNLTAVSGYYYSYMTGGIPGLYVSFLMMAATVLFLFRVLRISSRYSIVLWALTCAMLILTFFTNTLVTSSISFLTIYPLVLGLLEEDSAKLNAGVRDGDTASTDQSQQKRL